MKVIYILLVLLTWGFEKADAASAPALDHFATAFVPVTTESKITLTGAVEKEPGVVQRLKHYRLQKKWKPAFLHAREKHSGSKNVASTLAIIFAAIGVTGFVIPSIGVVLGFGLAALSTGIVAITKKNNTRSEKTKSIIAIVIGGLLSGIGLLALSLSTLFNGIE